MVQTKWVPTPAEAQRRREEAVRLVTAQGYSVKPKKTPKQERLEAQERQIAAQNERINKLLVLTESGNSPTPARQTLVEGANAPEQRELPAQIYTNGSYLRDQLHPANWSGFLDRTRPLPKGIDPNLALKEMGAFLSLRIMDMVHEGYGGAW